MNEQFDKIAPGHKNKVHFCFDILIAMAGVDLAMTDGRHSVHTPLLCFCAAVFWILSASVTRIYSPSTPRRLGDNLTLRAISVGVTAAGIGFLAWAVPSIDAQTVVLKNFAGFCFLLGVVGRMLAFQPLRRLSRPIQDVLIVGTGAMAKATYLSLTQENSPEQLSRVVGFLTLSGQPDVVDGVPLPVWGASADLLDVLQEHPVSEVYLAGRIVDYAAEMQAVVDACERVGMPFALPLHTLHFERAKLMSSSPVRDGYLHYMSTAQKPFQYALKRLLDIGASAAALLVLSPLLIIVAVLIKVTAPGPVMFTQKRVGLHGVTFDLLKFRSMVVNAEAIKETLMAVNEQSGPVFKMENDPRITRIGKFIRRYSIDELPQLINILRGDMTIVGPRPAVPKEVVQYKAWQRRRLSVRPGLTCYWQVGGRNAIGFEEWMRLDLRYVDNWTIWVDFSLIAQTFPAVIAGRGAS